jgi:hypothetical protein
MLASGFFDRRVPFVDAVFASITDSAARDTAASILYGVENNHGIAFLGHPHIIFEARDPEEDSWCRCSLQPFVAETHFLLSGSATQQLQIYDADGYDRGLSFRHWGGEIAEWANKSIVPRTTPFGKARPWEYIEFYMDSYITDHEYPKWKEALFDVVDRKTELYGWTFSPRSSRFTKDEIK